MKLVTCASVPHSFVLKEIPLCRKYTMLLNNIVVIVAVCLQSLAVHPVMFIFGRFIVGINSGNY